MNTSFHDLVRNRSSVRAYADRKVDREVIVRIIEAARLAPSACNRQPWRFVVADDPELVSRICTRGMHGPVPNVWAREAPVIIVIGLAPSPMVNTAGKVLKGIDYSMISAGIAGEHICLAAQDEGLGTCWIGWFRSRAVKKLCGIPSRIKLAALITLGYPRDTGSVPEKERMKRDEICFFNRYGEQGT
jgi:nitroreductase